MWDAKWWLRVSAELLEIDPLISPEKLFDPGLHGWMQDPDGGRPSLVEAANSTDVANALLSLGYYLGKSSTLQTLSSHVDPLPRVI